ncbi:VanZ family protein [Paenilisteria newyorkensis]|uniref:VanZ family protein n=1 Tax=Listeria newyorkensis TaxID=1497681 RepID=UPI002358C29B|nr:VanZ family protein [Listeria newyorkensis]WAO20414.1 VanZ family protein [Listeria newyorkensis]
MGYEEYTIDGIIPAFLILFVYAVIRVVLIFKNKRVIWSKEIIRLALVVYLVMLIIVTLFPINIIIGEYEQRYRDIVVNLNPLEFFGLLQANLQIIIRNLGGNLFMMIPYAILLAFNFKAMRKFRNLFITVLLTSITIEILQYIWQVTALNVWRATDINDVILNVAGGVIGYALYKYIFSKTPFLKPFILSSTKEKFVDNKSMSN